MPSNRRLLSKEFGYEEYVHIDPDRPEGFLLESVQDCEPIMERAKMLSELNPGKEFRHAAIIPKVVYDQAVREGWHLDKERWKKWANDPDNRAFRTWPGQL